MQTLHLFNGEDAQKTQFPQFEQPQSYGSIHDQKNKNNL